MDPGMFLKAVGHHSVLAGGILFALPNGCKFCRSPSNISQFELCKQEIQHLRKAFTKCKYPKWTLDKIERRFNSNNQEDSMRETTRENKVKVILTTPVQPGGKGLHQSAS